MLSFPFYGSGKREDIYKSKYRAETFQPAQLRLKDDLVGTRPWRTQKHAAYKKGQQNESQTSYKTQLNVTND